MSKVEHVLLVGQHFPVIHGQSSQFSKLLRGSDQWADINISSLNTVYAETRDDLSRASLLKLLKMARYAFEMCYLSQRLRPRVIVLSPAFNAGSFLKDSFFILLAKYVCRAKVIGWIHMDPNRLEWGSMPKWYRRYSVWVVSRLNLLVSCAPALPERWPAFLKGVPVAIVTNGVRGREERVNRESLIRDSTKIGFLSAMDSKKGWKELFNVAQQCCKLCPLIEFHFYGELGMGESMDEVLEVFANQPYKSRVSWIGGVSGKDKMEAFESMDLYCLPSHTEALPLVILEAMSFSLPIVSTDVGAVSDAVIEGKGGWLCEAKSEDSLMLALTKALEARSDWPEMGSYNRRLYEQNFSIEKFLGNWHILLAEQIGIK